MRYLRYLAIVVATAQMAPATARTQGQKVYQAQDCARCHSIAAAGADSRRSAERQGPDLSNLSRRYRAESLADYLKQELAVPGRGAHGFKGTDEELQALVDWLLEQK